MPSKRGYRAIGAGLMALSNEIHTNRREKLEQQKADNLNNIAQQRTDLMGKQVDLMGERNAADAAHRAEVLRLQDEQKVRDDERESRAEAFRQNTSTWQQQMQAANAKVNELTLGIQQSGLDAQDKAIQLESNSNFIAEIPNVISSHLNIEDLEGARLYNTALEKIFTDPAYATAQPKELKSLIVGLADTLNKKAGVTKLDAGKLEQVYGDLRARAKAMGADISEPDMQALVAPHVKPPEPETEDALSSTNTLNPAYATTKRYADQMTPLPHYKRNVPPLAEDRTALVNSIAQVLAEPDLLEGGELMNMLPISIGNRVKAFGEEMVWGGGTHLEEFNAALPELEANWGTFQRRYPSLAGKTFEDALPDVYRMFGLTPPPSPVNKQDDGLMAGPRTPAPPTPETPSAGLMDGGFDPMNDY